MEKTSIKARAFISLPSKKNDVMCIRKKEALLRIYGVRNWVKRVFCNKDVDFLFRLVGTISPFFGGIDSETVAMRVAGGG